MRLELSGGSQLPRSIIANAQRCVNLYPEKNPPGAPTALTFYQRPGLTPLVAGSSAQAVRGVFRASNGLGVVVIGQNVFVIFNPAIVGGWKLAPVGALLTNTGKPCKFADNGTTGVLVDGSGTGYTVDLSSGALAPLVDATGTFQGGSHVDYFDTFIISNILGTKNFVSSLSNELVYDPLYIASKAGYPDPLQALIVNRRYLVLIGTLKSELWYDAGATNFPFAELPGTYFEHGTVAPYSVASQDTATYFLGRDLQGHGVVYRIQGYNCLRVSNHQLEYQIRLMAASGTLADAQGYTHQIDGHSFYVLTFPTGDQTWVFDESTTEWHQRGWTDPQGQLHRERANCYAFLWGTPVVGDWQNGQLYSLDASSYQDGVPGDSRPFTCVRGFPHIVQGQGTQGPILADGKRVRFDSFIADMECGAGGPSAGQLQLLLRWSDDRGRTFGNAVLQTGGNPGEFLTSPLWRGLGIARDRIFELEWAYGGPAALNGAWVSALVLDQTGN